MSSVVGKDTVELKIDEVDCASLVQPAKEARTLRAITKASGLTVTTSRYVQQQDRGRAAESKLPIESERL